MKITLLSAPNHKVIDRYGAWGEKNMYGKITLGLNRSPVLIAPRVK
ncbi:MAG: hypothetical protein CL394_07390 [Acidiferrobacteraceae bacterium]|nr:hypothetical protein [Acidiferrobacteraceae bacterium]